MSDVERLIRNELDGPGSISGYIRMWHTLHVKYGLYIPRVEVASLLRELDPAGVEQRKRHKLKRRKYNSPGPNYCWHVDGNDKLNLLAFQFMVLLMAIVARYYSFMLTGLTMIQRSWPNIL